MLKEGHVYAISNFKDLIANLHDHIDRPSVASYSASKLFMDLDLLIVLEMKSRFDERNALVLLLEVHNRPQIPPNQQQTQNHMTIQQLLQIGHSKLL
ncbi:hypothetical protein QUC31_017779, partial [Theobroma cacao]